VRIWYARSMWLALLALSGCSGVLGTADRPDVVMIVLDTVRADSFALYGGRVEAPAITSLAREGVVFERAFSHFTMTPESHWVMLSGLLPEPHLSLQVHLPWSGPLLTDRLRAEGWKTGAFVGGITMTDAVVHLRDRFDHYDEDWVFTPDGHRPASRTLAAAQAWRAAQTGPTFTLVHLFDAHAPYTPARRRFGEGRDSGAMPNLARLRAAPTDAGVQAMRDLYDSEIAELDDALAPFLATLAPDTIVLLTADHGESFRAAPLFEHSTVLQDEVLHVPLVIRAPGVAPGRVSTMVGLADVTPTLLTLVGLPVPDGLDGAAILPATPTRERHYARAYAPVNAPRGFAVRTPTWKAILHPSGEWSAYDLSADPAETTPLPLPSPLATAWDDYQAAVADTPAPAAPQRAAPTAPRHVNEALEALGYQER
jgi:arylsulfatase A-like enzyme